MLAGAPLGNPADASPRLRDALGSAEVVAAEDTRRLRRLAADLGVTVTGRTRPRCVRGCSSGLGASGGAASSVAAMRRW